MLSVRKKNSIFPFISVITPSFNKGKYIEQAIKSVLQQNYLNFEHIIIDGGSGDNTLEILKKYRHLKWVSEPDRSHIDAVNKGLKRSKGEIISILNADDFYAPGAFFRVAEKLKSSPESKVVVGNCGIVDEKGRLTETNVPAIELKQMLQPWYYRFPSNPSTYFYYKKIHKVIGQYDARIGPCYDYDFLLRLARVYKFHYINETLGNWRFYKDTITYKNRDNNLNDLIKISKKNCGNYFSSTFYLYYLSYYSYRLKIKDIIAFLRRKIAFRTRI